MFIIRYLCAAGIIQFPESRLSTVAFSPSVDLAKEEAKVEATGDKLLPPNLLIL